MPTDTLVHATERSNIRDPAWPRVAEWLVAMGQVVHRLDYGGRIAAVARSASTATDLLARAYPLATVDRIDSVDVAHLDRTPGGYDLVCLLDGLTASDDPIASARAALRAAAPTGAVMIVEHGRADAFGDGPLAVGSWLTGAGAARVRLAAASPHEFVVDARPAR